MTATRGGLVIGGLVIPVEGMRIDNFVDGGSSKHLHAKGYRKRSTKWVRQACIHTTKGLYPQPIADGVGPTAADQRVLDYYKGADEYNGCHLMFDGDSGICAADLLFEATNNAGRSNDYCFGVEMYQEGDGTVRRATIANAVAAVIVALDTLEIPRQIAIDPYANTVIERLKEGGPDVVGVYGHRDQAWRFPSSPGYTAEQLKRHPQGYAARGRGDPGDEVYAAFLRAGLEGFHYGNRQDRTTWARRQAALTRMGEPGLMRLDGGFDGIAGQRTMQALKRRGFATGRDLDIATGAAV